MVRWSYCSRLEGDKRPNLLLNGISRSTLLPIILTMNGKMELLLQPSRRRQTFKALICIAALCAIQLCTRSISYEDKQQHDRRRLYVATSPGHILNKLHSDWNYNVDESEEDYNTAAALAMNSTYDVQHEDTVQMYTITDALNEASIFESTFCILVYDPTTDRFIVHYSKDMEWTSSNGKLWGSLNSFTYMLRETFPERFTKDSDELVIPIGSGDYPHVMKDKLPYTDGVAPLLQFGSVFRDTSVYPNMIAMPMPTHMKCFKQWAENGSVCDMLTSKHLVFSQEDGLEFDSLTPQLIWRGTDFTFLPSLQASSRMLRPMPNRFHLDPRRTDVGWNNRETTIKMLNDKIDTLVPRWKGVALTTDAELKAENTNDVAWANIKFSSQPGGDKPPTIGSQRYEPWEKVDIAVGKSMNLQELAKYKYHIDLGGGGGTTWSGTIEKLALPGLLFHHMTPTKDYIHDYLTPWKHYIPVSENLQDLKKKFDWAEAHPREAKRIADAGTDFMRELGTPQGFRKLYDEVFVEPLKRVIEAYQPVSTTHPDKSWRDIIGGYDHIVPVMECTGTKIEESKAMHLETRTHSTKVG